MGTKKKSLLDQYILHNSWMATNYNRVLLLKAREYLGLDKDGKVVRKHKKGPKLPTERIGDRDRK